MPCLRVCGAVAIILASILVINPTHKRTEGRAPVWGSECTSKDAAIQGGVQQKPLLGYMQILAFGDCLVASYPLVSGTAELKKI